VVGRQSALVMSTPSRPNARSLAVFFPESHIYMCIYCCLCECARWGMCACMCACVCSSSSHDSVFSSLRVSDCV
jgi:hypothetical protein